jgi:hypothetical protein
MVRSKGTPQKGSTIDYNGGIIPGLYVNNPNYRELGIYLFPRLLLTI